MGVFQVLECPPREEATPGIPGDSTFASATALEPINPLSVLAVRSGGRVYPASSSVVQDAERVVGVALGSAFPGEEVSYRTYGEINQPHGFPLGALFLGPEGELTANRSTGIVRLRIATAVTSTQIIVRIGSTVRHAA